MAPSSIAASRGITSCRPSTSCTGSAIAVYAHMPRRTDYAEMRYRHQVDGDLSGESEASADHGVMRIASREPGELRYLLEAERWCEHGHYGDHRTRRRVLVAEDQMKHGRAPYGQPESGEEQGPCTGGGCFV